MLKLKSMRWQWHSKYIILFAILATINATAQSFQFDSGKSTIEFEIAHLGVLTVTGHFKDFDGTMAKTKWGWNISGEIDVNSINTGNSERDATILGKQYLNAIEFPKIIFKGRAVASADKYWVNGTMMLRGKKKQLSFNISRKDSDFTAKEIILSRKQLELDFGGMDGLIGDEIKVMIMLSSK